MHNFRLVLFGFFYIMIASGASAADLYLLCDVTSSKDDGSQRTYQMRYDITWDTRTVRIHQNFGSGWSFNGTRTQVVTTDDEIVLQNNDAARFVINRSTGKIEGRRKSDRVVFFRGTCEKTTQQQNKF